MVLWNGDCYLLGAAFELLSAGSLALDRTVYFLEADGILIQQHRRILGLFGGCMKKAFSAIFMALFLLTATVVLPMQKATVLAAEVDDQKKGGDKKKDPPGPPPVKDKGNKPPPPKKPGN